MINRGVGVLLASQTVIQTERRGDLGMRAAPAYFTTCSATICSITQSHMHTHTDTQKHNLAKSRMCPYLTDITSGHIQYVQKPQAHIHTQAFIMQS